MYQQQNETDVCSNGAIKNRLFLILDMQIRLDLIEHIPHVATISCGTPHEEVIYDYVTSIIIRYLKDQDNQVNISCAIEFFVGI